MANMIEQSLLCKVLDAPDLEILHSNGVIEEMFLTKNDRRLQTYTLNYSTGVDEIKDTLDLAIMLGIISQAGAWFKATLKDGKEQKMQGFNGVQEFYYNDLGELEYLRKQVYEAGMA